MRVAVSRAVPVLVLLISLATSVVSAQPTSVSYQGELLKDGAPYSGVARFKFVILGGGVSLWSNDGTSAGGSEPAASVNLTADGGIFSVLLGAAPMIPLTADDLADATSAQLRVWVNTGAGFEQLSDQPLASSAFALNSETAMRALTTFTVEGDGIVQNDPGLVVENGAHVHNSAGGFISQTYFPTGDGWSFNTSGMGANFIILEGGGADSGVSAQTDAAGAIDGFATRLTIEAGGEVGIGTTSPDQLLDVAGAIKIGTTANNIAGSLRWTGGDFQGYNGVAWQSLTTSVGGNTLDQAYDQGGAGAGRTINATAGAVNITGLGGLTVAGNVGIGTTSPGAKLDVVGTARVNSNFGTLAVKYNEGDGWRWTTAGSGADLWLQEDNVALMGMTGLDQENSDDVGGPESRVTVTRVRYEQGGNVAIGSSTPAEKLDVQDGGLQVTRNDAGRAMDIVTTVSGSTGQTANIERTQVPTSGNDILQIQVPAGSPDLFQFIEASRGTTNEWAVNGDGSNFTGGSFNGGGADFAEMLEVDGGHLSVEAGDLMVINPNRDNTVRKSSEANSTLVVGVYSSKPGFVGSQRSWMVEERIQGEGSVLTHEQMKQNFNEVPVAVVGIVPTKVSAENGAIRPGDLLVTSSTPGHAMKASDSPKVGTVIGKSLGSLGSGTGTIKVYVTVH